MMKIMKWLEDNFAFVRKYNKNRKFKKDVKGYLEFLKPKKPKVTPPNKRWKLTNPLVSINYTKEIKHVKHVKELQHKEVK
jgi:hypothetical protein